MSTSARTLRRLSLALVLLLASVAASAAPLDDVKIVGTVVDASTGMPLAGVQVYVENSALGTLTAEDGRYSIVAPRAAVSGQRLVAEIIGYTAQTAEVLATGDAVTDSVTVNFELAASRIELSEVIVDAARTPRIPDSRSADRAQPSVERRASEASKVPADAVANAGASVSTGGTVSAQRRESAQRTALPYSSPVRHADPENFEREQYARIVENSFRSVADHPLSTFSTDVDRASYSNIRRFLLRERRLPPVDAVQIEEMVNYFSYDYALPDGDDPVGITTEVGAAPWNPDHRLLRIGLATRPLVSEELPASNLVFLLDVSGSMQSADKLPLVKRSLRLLVDQLRPQDRVAVVVYAGATGLALESTSGRDKDRILDAIDHLEAGGSTAGGAGLRLAYHVARENFLRKGNNRVILATDGDFNIGESSDGAMVGLIEEQRRDGTFLTVLGFGTGNLQSEKMQSIAQHGNGTYGYIDGLEEARKVFVSELGGTLVTVAQDVKIQVEFNPEQVAAYRLIGYENRLLANEDFNDDRKDAGDLGAGHRVTALYEIVPAGSDSDVVGARVDPLRYGPAPRTRTSRVTAVPSRHGEIGFVKVRYKEPRGSRSSLVEQEVTLGTDDLSGDFYFAAAVAGFGMMLRGSENRGTITTKQVLALASEGLGDDLDGYRHGFLDLVRAYREIGHGERLR